MTNHSASRGFVYASLPGADSTETTAPTADGAGTGTEGTAPADD